MLRQPLIRLAAALALATLACAAGAQTTEAQRQAKARQGQDFGQVQSARQLERQIEYREGEGDAAAGVIRIGGKDLDVTAVSGASDPAGERQRLEELGGDEAAIQQAVDDHRANLANDPSPAAEALRMAAQQPNAADDVRQDQPFWRTAESVLRTPDLLDREFADCTAQTTYRDVRAEQAYTQTEETCERLNVLDRATRTREVRVEERSVVVAEGQVFDLTESRLNIAVNPDLPGNVLSASARVEWSGTALGVVLDGQPSPFRSWAFSYSILYDEANPPPPVCRLPFTGQPCQPGEPNCQCTPGGQTAVFSITVDYTVFEETIVSDPPEPLMESDGFCTARWTCNDSQPRQVGEHLIGGGSPFDALLTPLYPTNPETNTPASSLDPVCWSATADYDCPYNLGQLCWTAANGQQQCVNNGPDNTVRNTCTGRFDTPRCTDEPDPANPGQTRRVCTTCGFSRSMCTQFSQGHGGFCYVTTDIYTCRTPLQVPIIEATTRNRCTGETTCLGGECVDDTRHKEPVAGLGKAYAGMTLVQHVLSDKGIDLPAELADPYPNTAAAAAKAEQQAAIAATQPVQPEDIRLFPGRPMECKKALGGTLDCCRNVNAGGDSRWFELYEGMLRRGNADVLKARYEAEGDKPQGAWADLARGQVSRTTALDNPFTSRIESVTNDSAFGGFYAAGKATTDKKATLLEPVMTEYRREVVNTPPSTWVCSTEELDLAAQRSVGACTTIGSYCNRRILGACIEHRTSYCCFNSALSRMIQEHAVGGQAGIAAGAFGTPRDPQCPGINPAHIDSVDLSTMPLEEWVGRMHRGGMVPTAATMTASTNLENTTGQGSNLVGPGELRKNAVQRATERTAGLPLERVHDVLEDEVDAQRRELPAYRGAGEISFGPALYFTRAGVELDLIVNRQGGTGAIAAAWYLENLPPQLAGQFVQERGRIQWSAGEAGQKPIRIRIPTSDAIRQAIRQAPLAFRVRLEADVPVEPVTSARVVLSDPGAAPVPPGATQGVTATKRFLGFERYSSPPNLLRAWWSVEFTNNTSERLVRYTLEDVLPAGILRGSAGAGSNSPITFYPQQLLPMAGGAGDWNAQLLRYCFPQPGMAPTEQGLIRNIDPDGTVSSATCFGITPIEPGQTIAFAALGAFDARFQAVDTTNRCRGEFVTESGQVILAGARGECAAAAPIPPPAAPEEIAACQARGQLLSFLSIRDISSVIGESFIPQVTRAFNTQLSFQATSYALPIRGADLGRRGTISVLPVAGGATVWYARISPCPGDVSLPFPAAGGDFERETCSTVRTSGAYTTQNPIEFEITGNAASTQRCALAPDRTYYLTVVADDPVDGIQANQLGMVAGCPRAPAPCNVQVEVRPAVAGPGATNATLPPASKSAAGDKPTTTAPPESVTDAAPPPPLRPVPTPSIYADVNTARTHNAKTPPPGYVRSAAPAEFVELNRRKNAKWTVGAQFDTQVDIKHGQYTAIAFTLEEDGGRLRSLEWLPGRGGAAMAPSGAFVAISDAPGDFRRPDADHEDPLVRPACRGPVDGNLGTRGRLYVRAGGSAANPGVCVLEPGRVYFINLIFDAPIDGFDVDARPCTDKNKLCRYALRFS